ncbi:hypothetical protein OAL10_12830 [Gammaproteobacteria bacterium]|nr:hypothetical protein [Gammaproteobacteria bacterium]
MTKLLTAAIHLALLMAVTSSVTAENAPQSLTKNLNLPPESINFDLSDLIDADQKQRDQKQKDEWAAYQAKMATAYSETQTFVDSNSDTAAGIEAWQRFLKAFEADNPFNKEDDSLRANAKNAMLGLQEIERTRQKDWLDYQTKMTKAYEEVLDFLAAEPDLKLQTQSIDRFLNAFKADNPFSQEDESLIKTALKKSNALKRMQNELSLSDQSNDSPELKSFVIGAMSGKTGPRISGLIDRQSMTFTRIDSDFYFKIFSNRPLLIKEIQPGTYYLSRLETLGPAAGYDGVTNFPRPKLEDALFTISPGELLYLGNWVIKVDLSKSFSVNGLDFSINYSDAALEKLRIPERPCEKYVCKVLLPDRSIKLLDIRTPETRKKEAAQS